MKTTIFKLRYLFFALIIAALASCKGEIGPPGADGVDGIDGTDGTDGNANVVTINLLSSDIVWSVGSYFGRTSNVFTLDTAAVTQDIVDHGTVLGYAFKSPNWYSLPIIYENVGGTVREYILNTYSLNTINLFAYNTSGVLNPAALTEYKFLLITDNTVNKTESGEQNILNQLEKAGVDITNYYQVMDYYGLDY